MKRVICCLLLFLIVFSCGEKTTKLPEYNNFRIIGTIDGVKEDGFFGHSIVSIGDINNDGGEEIVISADGDGTEMQGKIYLFHSENLKDSITANDATLHLEGIYRNDRFGWTLDSGCDISGDGIPDLIVGAIGCQVKGPMTGGVYLFYGEKQKERIIYRKVNTMISGEIKNSTTGWFVTIQGDINNDNVNDIIIGAPGYNDNTGRVYVFYGKEMPEMVYASDADIIFTGENKNDNFGNSISVINNLNGDKKKDLLITAWMNSDAGENAGKAYVFYNKEFPQEVSASDADVMITGDFEGDFFGEYSTNAGDVNDDGRDDFLIGAGLSNMLYGEGGGVYLFRSELNEKKLRAAEADMTFAGLTGGVKLGSFILAPGDVDRDGKPDIFIGGTSSEYPDQAGRVYFYSNDRLLIEKQTAQPTRIIRGIAEEGRFGNSFCAADIDGDGYKELLVGAYYHSGAGKHFGRVYIYKIEK